VNLERSVRSRCDRLDLALGLWEWPGEAVGEQQPENTDNNRRVSHSGRVYLMLG
jgi:hypothetical protein